MNVEEMMNWLTVAVFSVFVGGAAGFLFAITA